MVGFLLSFPIVEWIILNGEIGIYVESVKVLKNCFRGCVANGKTSLMDKNLTLESLEVQVEAFR